jgi:DNA-directed RNA polymerase specialized sigma subunit
MDDLQINDHERKKRYLKRYKKNLALIYRLEDKLDDLNERIYKIKSPTLSAMPKGSKPVEISDLISDKNELKARIERLRKKGETLKAEILEIIDDLDDVRYAEICESFFIDCKSLEDISEEMGYTVRHVTRLYSEAISQMSI